MTCPPDALNSGTDLVVLQPGATWTVRWGLEALP
jgi:aldose 1-epimerase